MKWRDDVGPTVTAGRSRRQAGVLMVEFALVAMLFLTLLLAIMEFGRWLFTLNAAAEATRWGARVAAVCGSSETAIQDYVGIMLRSGNGTLKVSYPDASCMSTDCLVTVELRDASFTPLIPFFGEPIALPSFVTRLPREALDGASTDVCPPG